MILIIKSIPTILILWFMKSTSSSHLEESSSSYVARKDTLQLVQVIFRHGARAPTKTYPNDPHRNIWPDGMAQLTSLGKMEQYELGQFLRQRYDGYLGKTYNQKELYTLCSDMDRTIMSLESNLAGLFPPVNFWNPKIDWQPIPLRTIPWREDRFLHNNVKCPRYKELRVEFVSSSPVAQKLNEENKEFIRYCEKHSGLAVGTVKELYPLLDVLYSQAAHNFTLPYWVSKGNVLPKLIELQGFVNTWPTYTEEMKRLWGGPFLNLLINNMRAIAGDLGSPHAGGETHAIKHGINRKMLMYSAHDSTLSRIMNTMGIFEAPHCPPFAAAIIIELHRDPDTLEYYVEYHYRNDTTRAPYLLTHEKCEYPCKLWDLIDIYRPLIPVDWEKECKMGNKKGDSFFTLKMSEDDDTDDHVEDDDDEYRRRRRPTDDSSDYYYDGGDNDDDDDDTVWNFTFMGVLCVISTFLVLVIINCIRIIQLRKRGVFYNDEGDDDVERKTWHPLMLFGGYYNPTNSYYRGRFAYEKL